MATEEKEVRSVLNDLIETCKDGEQGFRTAAEKVEEPALQSLFPTTLRNTHDAADSSNSCESNGR